MKKLFLIVFLFSTLQCQFGFSQNLQYGVHVGGNISRFHSGNVFRVYDNKWKVGYEIGGDVKCQVTNHICLLSGLTLVQAGGKFSAMINYYQGALTEFPEINAKIVSLEVPLKIGYSFALSENVAIVPNIGIYGRYALASIKDNVITVGDDSAEKWDAFKDYNKGEHQIDAMKRWDFGVAAGLEVQLLKHYSVSLRYNYGLRKQSQQYDIKNQGISLSIGYTW